MTEIECKHTDKVANPSGRVLCSYPPISVIEWICKDCGFEWEEQRRSVLDTEYEDTKAIFAERKICQK